MWGHIALFIIKYRQWLLGLIAIFTVTMAWFAKDVEMTYDFAQVVSPKDPDMVYFQQFKKTFGEDGNILVLGMQDSSVYQLAKFNQLHQLTDTLAKVEGVSGVLGITRLSQIEKDTVSS
jgi:predicted RND superfamily exporter protein